MLVDGAEVVDDSVALLSGQRVTRRFRELEVELVGGEERTLRRLVKELRRAGATEADELRPKLYRALDLPLPEEEATVPPGTPAGATLGIALGEQARRLLLHDPGVRLGSDPRTSISSASPPGVCAPSSGQGDPFSSRRGRSRSVTRSAGSAGRSGPRATSMC